MQFYNTQEDVMGGKAASQAYWNALNKLRDAWRDVFGEELEAHGNRAMTTFENALENLKERLRLDPDRGRQILNHLDVEPDEDIGQALLRWADIDDLSPNRVKDALCTEFRMHGAGRHELRPILRAVFDGLFDTAQIRRPRVGPNRHWPRMLQYLRELETETDQSPDGRGVRLSNLGGRGPVAQMPKDPTLLSVTIDPDYL